MTRTLLTRSLSVRTSTQRGFTLLEIVVSMALMALISVVLASTLGPWMKLKQKIDTDHKLSDLQSSLTLLYSANAMTAEDSSGAAVSLAAGGQIVSSSIGGDRRCQNSAATWQAMAPYLAEGPTTARLDGGSNEFCIFVSPQLQTQQSGVTLYYHNIAIVSTGVRGMLDPGTGMDPSTGALSLGGDNAGVMVSGLSIQVAKLASTQNKLDTLATLYGTYFTTQYLANSARDISIDYFAAANPTGLWDSASGSVQGTAGQENYSAFSALSVLGVTAQDTQTDYETNTTIYLANYNECPAGQCVRSNWNGGSAPFTAILYAPVPGPGGNFAMKVVSGNY
ncbi:type II secretion system protein [Paraburkholderia sp. UCT31]|uniref:type II secretion system protein n=1 Tax=Paraburkholderia sp. UCT31 TaxID=2615209 RepID=UPI00223BED50|nr:type II secretion system protein [Paraburkholderia sp. UCT31]